MALNDDYVNFANKLLVKTEQGKLRWQGTYDATTFIAIVEGEYKCEIEKSGWGTCTLTMRDKDETEVFSLIATSPDQNTLKRELDIYNLLVELYERARRTALDIDKKVAEAANLLDRL